MNQSEMKRIRAVDVAGALGGGTKVTRSEIVRQVQKSS